MGNYQNFEESEKRKFLSSYNKNPEDFYILRKVPISKHPILANLPFYFAQGISGDVNIIILKLYTSGSNYQRDNWSDNVIIYIMVIISLRKDGTWVH